MGSRFAAIVMAPMVWLMLVFPAQAQTPDQQFGHWKSYSMQNGNITICYIASDPVIAGGTFKSRGKPYAMVTSRAPSKDEFSSSAGYPFKLKEPVTVAIDGKKFTLFSEYETAWAYDGDQDKAMVAAMKEGKTLVVRGLSHKDTSSEDTYSLEGFTAAHKRMKELCK